MNVIYYAEPLAIHLHMAIKSSFPQSTGKISVKSLNAPSIALHSLLYFRKLIKRLIFVNETEKHDEVVKQTPFHHFHQYLKYT
jgi:hypothetical protein